MKKSYPDKPVDSSVTISEPVAAYGCCSTFSSDSIASVSAREQVLANTVSVDQYFDELISQVHYDLTPDTPKSQKNVVSQPQMAIRLSYRK